MELAQAIDGWLRAHDAALSSSTQRDIADIGVAVAAAGFAEVDCNDLREPHRLEIIAAADGTTSLNAEAIGQFLAIVAEWGADQPGTPEPDADTDDTDPDIVDVDPEPQPSEPEPSQPEPSQPESGAPEAELVADAPPVIDDLDLADDWADELPPIELDLEAPEAEATEPEATEPEATEPEAPAPVPDRPRPASPPPQTETLFDEQPEADEPEPEPDERYVDEDDLDDDELDTIDADLTFTDEDDLDDDELDTIDADLATAIDEDEAIGEDDPDDEPEIVITVGDEPSAPAAAPPAEPGAASFLQTLEQTTSRSVFGDLTQTEEAGDAAPSTGGAGAGVDRGVFSEAAEFEAGQRSIDWITVAYFGVAVICFGLVIYFYLSS